MRLQRRNRRTGLSMVELVLALSIGSILMMSASLATAKGKGAFESTTRAHQLQEQLRRAIERAAVELIASGPDVLTPPDIDDDYGTSDLVFQQAVGATGTNIDWGTPMRLAREYAPGEADDGVDNNGDGLVDEGILVLTRDDGGPNERRIVLCRNVRELFAGEEDNDADDNGNGVRDEAGFNVHRNGDVLTIRLSVEDVSDGPGPIVRNLTTSVRLRN